jgi:hypothetical protein
MHPLTEYTREIEAACAEYDRVTAPPRAEYDIEFRNDAIQKFNTEIRAAKRKIRDYLERYEIVIHLCPARGEA